VSGQKVDIKINCYNVTKTYQFFPEFYTRELQKNKPMRTGMLF